MPSTHPASCNYTSSEPPSYLLRTRSPPSRRPLPTRYPSTDGSAQQPKSLHLHSLSPSTCITLHLHRIQSFSARTIFPSFPKPRFRQSRSRYTLPTRYQCFPTRSFSKYPDQYSDSRAFTTSQNRIQYTIPSFTAEQSIPRRESAFRTSADC
jgi:hypothetical protein